jgi:L-threonylcarbamoyladenylate synthase
MRFEPATSETITEAGRLLRDGCLVAFPTETVYGLGADATNSQAVARIFEAKGRPRFNPLIAHVPDLDAARKLAVFTPMAETLAQAFWPGPLTLVLRKAAECPVADLATAGLETIALRIPGYDVARAILAAAGVPIAAPSANRSGRLSPTHAGHVLEELGAACALIVDGGPTGVGLESTVVDATGAQPVLLRPGAITRADIAHVTKRPVEVHLNEDEAPTAPGQLRSHYAPLAHVRLDANSVALGEGLLAFGPDVPGHDGPMINLSPRGDLREAAVNLFAALRSLDTTGIRTIAVMPIPDEGLGEAINDRLRRASAPR